MDKNNNFRDNKGFNVGGIITGMNIVLLGLIFLLGNIGIINFGYLPYFWRLWPLVLVGIGLNIILVSNGVKYAGVSMISLILIIILLGSSVGQTGTQTRILLDINEQPIEMSLNNIGKYFSNEWKKLQLDEVKQTFNGTIDINESFNNVSFSMYNNQLDGIEIRFISSANNQIIDYSIGVMSDMEFSEEPKPIVDLRDDGTLSVEDPDMMGKHFILSLDFHINPESSIQFPHFANSFTLEGEWMGDIELKNIGSGDFTAERLLGQTAIRTISGDIRCDHVTNGDINNSSGNIEISEAGELDIQTTSGDVFIGQVSSLNVNTTSSDIKCDEILDNTTIQSTSGSVEVRNLVNNAVTSIKTVSGDIDIHRFQSDKGAVELRTVSGNIDMRIAKATEITSNAINGEITTTTGDIDIKLSDVSDSKIEYDQNRFVIGSGECRMVIKTTSGDIDITDSEQ